LQAAPRRPSIGAAQRSRKPRCGDAATPLLRGLELDDSALERDVGLPPPSCWPRPLLSVPALQSPLRLARRQPPRQQAFSASVSELFGARHAIAGAKGNHASNIEATILTTAFISRKYSRTDQCLRENCIRISRTRGRRMARAVNWQQNARVPRLSCEKILRVRESAKCLRECSSAISNPASLRLERATFCGEGYLRRREPHHQSGRRLDRNVYIRRRWAASGNDQQPRDDGKDL
jgi:hypothetical protein